MDLPDRPAMNPAALTFTDDPPPADHRVVTLPTDLTDRSILFAALADGLDLPTWFGRNWDALADSLSSYEDPASPPITLVHPDLPLCDEDDLATYLEVLIEALERRREQPALQPTLAASFPTAARARITALLAEP